MSEPDWTERNGRGQLSLSAVEAGIGVLLIFAVAATFSLGLPDPGTHEAQLDTYAHDTLTVLAGEAPRHQRSSRLAEVSHSEAAFQRERNALQRRVERILPANLFFRVETPHGVVGFHRPTAVPVGHATVATTTGDVTMWVWYA